MNKLDHARGGAARMLALARRARHRSPPSSSPYLQITRNLARAPAIDRRRSAILAKRKSLLRRKTLCGLKLVGLDPMRVRLLARLQRGGAFVQKGSRSPQSMAALREEGAGQL